MNHGNLGRENADTKKAVERPTTRDIAWAAGFFEGEGSVRKVSKVHHTPEVRIGQLNKEPVEKMLRLFGGALHCYKTSRGKDIWTWAVYGSRCRGFVMTIYQFLSDRRKEQVLAALA